MSETISTTVNITMAAQKNQDKPSPSIRKTYSKKPIHKTSGEGINGKTMPTKLNTKQTMISNHTNISNNSTSCQDY